MRILVVGDPYCPTSSFRTAFEPLQDNHVISYLELDDGRGWRPSGESASRLREFMGDPSDIVALMPGVEVLVVQGAPVTDEVLAASLELRLVCCVRGGPVNVDVDAASARGIPVVTTPGKNAEAVADLTLGLIVMLSRRLPEAMGHVSSGGGFGRDNYEGKQWFGHDLADRTLGIVGFGQIGRRVAERALAFRMRVVAADPHVPAEAISAAGVRPVNRDELVAMADVISLHARADERPLLGPTEFDRMRPGVVLVNTARASLIDEHALIKALEAGRLMGVGLDVLSPSLSDGTHPVLRYRNVVVLPHIGGATFETLQNGAAMAAAEIGRLTRGDSLRNVANADALDSLDRAPHR